MPTVRDGWNWVGDRIHPSKSPNLLLVICLLFHVYDAMVLGFRQSSVRLGFYIVIAVFAWATTFKSDPSVMDVDDLKTPLILSTLSFLFPYLGNLIPFLQASQIYQWFVVFFPIWVIYLTFAVGGTSLTNIIRWGVIIFWVFLALPTLIYSLSIDLNLTEVETGLNINQVVAGSWSKFKSNAYRFGDNLKQIPKNIISSFNKMMNYATGGLYASDVEKNEKEPIGVYLENVRPSDSKFYEGERVTVWGNIKAKNFEGDMDKDDIDVDISCYAEENKNKIEGNVTPKHMNVAGQEEEWIDCVFERLNSGRPKVVINALFNFETKSYLKTYYMNKETLRTLNRENVDVLSKYGISHVNPVTIFTNGPVGIGIGSVDPLPVGIWVDGENENVPLYFGISLDNRWEGKIREITELEVQVHDSLELTNCDHEFNFVETNKDGYDVYHMVPSKKTENITNFYTIRCRLNVEDPNSLLDNNPITTREFRVSAKYIYELEKSTTVEIIKVEDYKSEENAMTDESEIRELNDQIDKEVCKEISTCSDYNANFYDKLGFDNQIWCDTDPCNLNCYSYFKKSGSDVYYESCSECPRYTTIQGLPSKDYCNIYLSKDYCEKDICNFRENDITCRWDGSTCGMSYLKEEVTTEGEDWKNLPYQTTDEIKSKLRSAAEQNNIPPEILLGVGYTESTFNKNEVGDNGESIGLMQINYEIHKYKCNLNSKEDIFDINRNIECAISIIKGHYNSFCDAEGRKSFRNKVNYNCENQEYRDKYNSYSYESDCWNMVLRAYNGFGCANAEIADYVEEVREGIEKEGFDK
ncbi:MAG: transglycosylase SLT domain-containing protein [Candidatus Nanoarchaeia archaeon]|nr:transglycosylase SLT domain-containing protein [Candidatus Nanoarchaeia archaeon]